MTPKILLLLLACLVVGGLAGYFLVHPPVVKQPCHQAIVHVPSGEDYSITVCP